MKYELNRAFCNKASLYCLLFTFFVYRNIFCNIKLKLKLNGDKHNLRTSSTFTKHNGNSVGLQRASQSSLQLQLAPSLEHQTAAMLSILERYKWHQFSVVTSQIAGHDDFIQAVRERISDMQDTFKFTILSAILVTEPHDLLELVNSESRVMLLYSTREEATHILTAAREYKITGENYVWVVTQSVIENLQTPSQFPVGMLGK